MAHKKGGPAFLQALTSGLQRNFAQQQQDEQREQQFRLQDLLRQGTEQRADVSRRGLISLQDLLGQQAEQRGAERTIAREQRAPGLLREQLKVRREFPALEDPTRKALLEAQIERTQLENQILRQTSEAIERGEVTPTGRGARPVKALGLGKVKRTIVSDSGKLVAEESKKETEEGGAIAFDELSNQFEVIRQSISPTLVPTQFIQSLNKFQDRLDLTAFGEVSGVFRIFKPLPGVQSRPALVEELRTRGASVAEEGGSELAKSNRRLWIALERLKINMLQHNQSVLSQLSGAPAGGTQPVDPNETRARLFIDAAKERGATGKQIEAALERNGLGQFKALVEQ